MSAVVQADRKSADPAARHGATALNPVTSITADPIASDLERKHALLYLLGQIFLASEINRLPASIRPAVLSH